VSWLDEVRAVVGAANAIDGGDLAAYEIDWRKRYHGRALAVVRPASTNEVAAVVRICAAHRVPIVTQGGNTGLVGASVPDASGSQMLLSLARMNRVRSLDAANLTMTVDAGCVLQAVQEAAAAQGLLFPLSLAAEGSCTIGGNLATNAGGTQVLRYGNARELCLGLEVVNAAGEVWNGLTGLRKDNTGYDLRHLFIGSEGTLGVVTRAELRLVSRTRSQETMLASLPSFDALTELLGRLDSGLGGQLAAFEALWGNYYDYNTAPPAQNAAPLPRGAPFYVIAESLGGDPEADRARLEVVLGEALEAGIVGDVAIANSENERRAIWAIREDVWQVKNIGPLLTFDVSLPIENMKAYAGEVCNAVEGFAGSNRAFVFGHMADGNLHIVVAAGDDPATRARVEDIVYRPLAAIGGSVSAEHGIGLEKRAYLPLSRTAAEISTMRLLKQALDPRGILNPGKVFA
jgi:FAD/FMN-containing dehydrogenase